MAQEITALRSRFRALRDTARRGYTVVELMMSLAVFTIGVGGVVAMQKVTVASNQHAKNLATASHIAQAWLDELAAEAGQWSKADSFDSTGWLRHVGSEDSSNVVWRRPEYSATRNFGAAFDALGNPVPDQEIAARAHYCSDLRLSWLYSQRGVKEGGGLIRAQVRVYWLRDGVTGVAEPPNHVCALTPVAFDSAVGQRLFHVVYLTTAVRQHWRDE